jgi:hypothetical protein
LLEERERIYRGFLRTAGKTTSLSSSAVCIAKLDHAVGIRLCCHMLQAFLGSGGGKQRNAGSKNHRDDEDDVLGDESLGSE